MTTKKGLANESLQHLQNIVLRLDPILNPYGFVFELEGKGFSSLGLFASGFYRRGPLKIGLVYRSCFGSVNYSWDKFNMSHSDYMEHLGYIDNCKLIYDEDSFESIARDGGDAITTLIYDLEQFAKPMLEGNTDEFVRITKTVHETRLKRLKRRRE